MSEHVTIPMKVSGLTVDPFTGLPVVLLVDDTSGARVPIVVGCSEASALATELEGIEVERPMTHHLMGALLEAAGARVERVEVCDLHEGTFYARVHLCRSSGERVTRDARPSDALALALRTGAPIVVATRVIDEVGRLELQTRWDESPLTGMGPEELVDAFADENSYKWKM